MNIRVATITSSNDLVSRINAQRNSLNILQEQISTGKRINRPSDDPSGAEMVLNIRTSQKEIEQFQRNADTASQKLTAADDSLNGYQTLLDRVRTLVTQGLSDTSTQSAKNALATELDALRTRILAVANVKNGDDYLFGGTRQNTAPFGPTTAIPAATPTVTQYIQIEPGVNAIPVGVTADTVFSDSTSTIFVDLTNAVAALRGTGNAAADTATLQATNSRLSIYSDLSNNARAIVGSNINSTQSATESLTTNFSSLDQRAGAIEGTDFAAAAVGLTNAQNALNASLQVAAKPPKSLFDYLG